MSLRKTNGFSELTDAIEAGIASGCYSPGTQLPSMREYAYIYKLSLGAVQRGIDYLCQKGLLERRARCGVFVRASQQQPGNLRITVLVDDLRFAQGTYMRYVMLGIQDAALLANVAIELRGLPIWLPDERRAALLELPRYHNHSDALIFLGNFDSLGGMPIHCPAVGVEMHDRYQGNLSTISLDSNQAAELAADYFTTHRIGHVKIFSPEAKINRERARCFQSIWPDSELNPECDFSDLECGYLFTGGSDCDRAAKQYREQHGRLLVADRYVLSMDGKSEYVPAMEPMNVIFPDWQQAGTMALQEALRRLSSPGSASCRIGMNVKLVLQKEAKT